MDIITILVVICIWLVIHNTWLQIKYMDIIRIANHRAKLLDEQHSQIQEYKDALKKDLFPNP